MTIVKTKDDLQDIMKANPRVIQSWARIKLHPNLNPAFQDVGMPFDLATASVGGTEESITAAFKTGNFKRMHRILDAVLCASLSSRLPFIKPAPC